MADLQQLRERIAYGLAQARDFEGVDRSDVVAIKSDPELTRYSFVPSEVLAKADGGEMDDEKREATWVASDESTDSMGDVIRVKGWDLARYKANPTLLFGHDQKAPPVGIVQRMRKGEAADGRPALMATGTLFDREVDEFADRVWRIMQAGGLPGVSVGFRAGEINDPQEPEERKALGLGPYGLEFVKGHELLELSIVPVPANQNALRERCIKSADGEMERWLREGEASPAFVREFRKRLMLTAEQVAERAREEKRKAVPVEVDVQALTRKADAAEKRAEELAEDKRLLASTVTSLLDRERELKAESATLEDENRRLEQQNTELREVHEQLQKTVEEHRKGRGEDAQQPPATERDATEQQPPSSDRRAAARAEAFAQTLNSKIGE